MSTLAHAMWVHGHSVQVENPAACDAIQRGGFGVRIIGKKNTTNWVHCSIPTPVIVDDTRLRLASVMLWIGTASTDAVVTAVHVFQGAGVIKKFDNVNFSGPKAFKRFDLAERPPLEWGVGLSVGLKFGGDAESHFVDIDCAGCDFVR